MGESTSKLDFERIVPVFCANRPVRFFARIVPVESSQGGTGFCAKRPVTVSKYKILGKYLQPFTRYSTKEKPEVPKCQMLAANILKRVRFVRRREKMVQRVANSVRRVTDYDRRSTQNRTEIITGLKCNILASSPKTWQLKQGNLSVWDEKCRTVAALERCVLNTGSFACKIVRGEVQLAVERRGTLNTGGRNHKLDFFGFIRVCCPQSHWLSLDNRCAERLTPSNNESVLYRSKEVVSNMVDIHPWKIYTIP